MRWAGWHSRCKMLVLTSDQVSIGTVRGLCPRSHVLCLDQCVTALKCIFSAYTCNTKIQGHVYHQVRGTGSLGWRWRKINVCLSESCSGAVLPAVAAHSFWVDLGFALIQKSFFFCFFFWLSNRGSRPLFNTFKQKGNSYHRWLAKF